MTSERMSDAEIAAVRERAAATVDLWECSNMVEHDIPRLCNELEAARNVLRMIVSTSMADIGPIPVDIVPRTAIDNARAYLRATDAARSTEGTQR